jgi:hypothetical protein
LLSNPSKLDIAHLLSLLQLAFLLRLTFFHLSLHFIKSVWDL